MGVIGPRETMNNNLADLFKIGEAIHLEAGPLAESADVERVLIYVSALRNAAAKIEKEAKRWKAQKDAALGKPAIKQQIGG